MSINFDGFFSTQWREIHQIMLKNITNSTTFQKNYNNDQFVLGDNFKIPIFLLPAELSSKGNASVQF